MNETDLRRTVERIASALTSLGLRFHLTGGLASSYYGEPRTTRDADFVVNLAMGEVRPLVDALSGGFLINEPAVREAIGHGGMFQALDRETMIKVDFHVGELIPGELGRSEPKELLEGLSIPMVSKEDAILSKLVGIREGSDRSRTDVLGMLLDPTRFDLSLVRARARELGCADILDGLERDARNLRGPEAGE